MTFLMMLLLTGFVLVVATLWIGLSLISALARGIAWTFGLLLGGRSDDDRFIEIARRQCGNDKCAARLRPRARFCARCGQPAGRVHRAVPGEPIAPPRLQIAGGTSARVSRVA